MNRQEYQEKILCIKTDNVGLKLMEGIKIRNQYIDSLESDVEQLKAENAQIKSDNIDLMKQVEIIGKALDIACGFTKTVCGETAEHWKEYYKPGNVKKTGWQIYKELEPAKEPIADCDNCKHVCTKSNIDHCHMYEPKPTFKVGDWVEFIDAGGRKSQGKYESVGYNAILVRDTTYNLRCVVPTEKIIRKLAQKKLFWISEAGLRGP